MLLTYAQFSLLLYQQFYFFVRFLNIKSFIFIHFIMIYPRFYIHCG